MTDIFHPYASLFTSPNGPGDARPTALRVVQDGNLTDRYRGKVALITGGTSGIGFETARALRMTGADIFITARDMKKGQEMRDKILKSSEGQGKLEVIEMDMNSIESVKKAANAFLAKSAHLNILVNNAGIMAIPELTKTADGFEQHFGVNHLAHYALTALLLPALIKGSTPALNSRVICVTSAGHGFSTVQFDDTNLSDTYGPWIGYGQSKTANIWLANYVDRVYGSLGVHANAVHPGAVATPLVANMAVEDAGDLVEELSKQMKSPEQGAATSTWAAISNVWEGKGGKYLMDCGLGHPAVDASLMTDEGFAPHAFDIEGENRLWTLSSKLTGVSVA